MDTWTYILHFNTPLSIFSGNAAAGLVDRRVVRSGDGLPCVPGSTVKGRWRFFAERLLASTPLPPGLSMHDPKGPICKERKTACTLCRLFGSPAISSAVWIGQAELDKSIKSDFAALIALRKNPVVSPDVELRPGIAKSRMRCSTLPEHLFYEEAASAGVFFTGKIKVLSHLEPIEKQFLFASAKFVDRIGARKAAGRGVLAEGINILGSDK